MKTSTVFSLALLGFAAASPVPQDIDFDSYEEVPVLPATAAPIGAVPTTSAAAYNQPSAVSEAVAAATNTIDPILTKRDLLKRGNCQATAPGNGPAVTKVFPASAEDFVAEKVFADAANNAKAPSGYFLVDGFQNKQGSAQGPGGSYLTFISDPLTSYDTAACAAKCNSIKGCNSFNIYFERNPSIDIDATTCPDADPVTRIKCAFWTTALVASQATNVGQYTGNFHVVITGSNAYTTYPQPQPGYTGPVDAGDASIISPTAANTYMGVQSFPATQPYDPAVCAAACTEKSAYNTRHATPGTPPRLCKFFDAYILYKNGQNGVFTCTYYTEAYDVSFATNHGQYRSGDFYGPGHSYLYTATAQKEVLPAL